MKPQISRRAFLFLAISCATPAAAKKPLNYRLHKKPAVSTAAAAGYEAKAEKAPAPIPPYARLMSGRWTPEAKAAIEKMLLEKGRASADYDARRPPVAVLPWSDAAVAGDPAELAFLRLVSDAKFKMDDDWWRIVPLGYGRQSTRAAYEQFISLSSAVWTQQPSYHAWRKGMLNSYTALCAGVGRKECRSYLARLWSGWREDDAADFVKTVLTEEKARPGTSESIPGEPGDRSPLRARRGLRVIPEIRDLCAKLRAAGFDVWVIDDVPQPVLATSAADYGIDPSRVYGVHNSTDGARMGPGILKPVPTRGGKAEVLLSSLGRAADFAVGRDRADAELLEYGEGLRVVFDSDREFADRSRDRGWLVQPTFAR
jgi:phosphoserine phosphatase